MAEVLNPNIKHLVVPYVQCLQQVQSFAQTAVQILYAVVADVKVKKARVRCERLRGDPRQSVVRHVQAGEVPGKVLRDFPEAEVAAVGSATLHIAGGLFLAGHIGAGSHQKVACDDHCRGGP